MKIDTDCYAEISQYRHLSFLRYQKSLWLSGRKTNMLKKHFLLFAILFGIAKACFPFAQNEKAWFALNALQILSPDKKWQSLIYSRFQFIDNSHPWQATLVEGALGYQFVPHHSFWAGYRWTAVNPNNNFFQENRLFQQVMTDFKINHDLERILIRSRLEEIERTNQNQIDVRWRERVAMEIEKPWQERLYPYFYEEVFLQIATTNYSSNKTVSQNRIFIGFNWRETKKTWWEIGYINQFLMSTPLDTQNTMSHVISVTYNFFN